MSKLTPIRAIRLKCLGGHSARTGQNNMETKEVSMDFRPKIVHPRQGEHHPAVLQCSCGNHIDLWDPLDNECEACGLYYNMTGQQVIPSWDSRVEEQYWDDY